MSNEPTKREKRLKSITARAEKFFEWTDPENRTYVTLTSAVLFAERMVEEAERQLP